MGRFKRRKKKSNTQVINTLNADLVIPQFVPKNKCPKTKRLFIDLFLSLKKRNKFGDFINFYEPIKLLLTKNDETNARDAYHVHNYFFQAIPIGKDIKYYHYVRNRNHESFFDNLLGRITILNGIIRTKYRTRTSFYFGENSLCKGDMIGYYVADKLKAKGKDKNVYPNELAFGFLFGTIFTILGLISIVMATLIIFSSEVVIIILTIIILLLILFASKLSKPAIM